MEGMKVLNRRDVLALAGWSALGRAFGADSRPDLSGEWLLDVSRSDLGPQAPPERWVRTVAHKEPTVTITTLQERRGQQLKAEFTLRTDGTETKFQMGGSEATGSAQWDGRVLVIRTKRATPAGTIEQNERATLSEDGKTLTFAVTIRYEGNDVPMRLVFAKR